MQNQKFTVPKLGLVLFLVITILSLALSMKMRLSAEELGRTAGAIVGLLFWSTVVSWVAWRITRRAELVKNVAFCLVLLTLGAGQVLRPVKALKHQSTVEDLRKAITVHQDDLRHELETEGSLSIDPERTDRLIRSIEKSAENVDGNELATINATTRMLRKMHAYEQAYQKAVENLAADSIISPAGVTNVTQLDRYRQTVTQFMAANEELAQISNGAAELLKEELRSENLPQRTVEAALRGFQQSYLPRRKIIKAIREQDAQLGTNLLAILDLYQSNWGKWRYNPEDELAVFEDAAHEDQYAAAIDSIVLLSDQQQASQQELVDLPLPGR